MGEQKEKSSITLKSIFLKLLDAIIGIFVGICKGLQYLLTSFPFILVALFVLLIFFNEQTITALDWIKQRFSWIG